MTSAEKIGEAVKSLHGEDLFRQLVEVSPLALVVTDKNGHIVLINAQTEKLFGYTRQELLGQSVEILIPKTHRNEHKSHRRSFILNPEIRSMGKGRLLSALKKDGREIPVEIGLNPFNTSEGLFVLATVIDLSERQRVQKDFQKERDRAQRFLDMAGTLLVGLDPHGKVVLLNRRGSEILGWTEKEVLGVDWFDHFVPKRLRKQVKKVFDDFRLGKTQKAQKYENTVITKDGKERVISWDNVVITDDKGNFAGTLSSGEDITHQRDLEYEVLKISEREQRRIGQDLHDGLGQELTGISYLAQYLYEKLKEKNLSEAEDASKIVERVGGSIGQVRGLARGLYPVVINTQGFFPAVQELATQLEHDHGISCQVLFDALDSNMDPSKSVQLYRIVQEAINNSIKHGRAKNLRIVLERYKDKVTLSVFDDGDGMPPVEQRGKGLGLHIMAYRARTIGASFKVKRTSPKGTEVCCVLPGSLFKDKRK